MAIRLALFNRQLPEQANCQSSKSSNQEIIHQHRTCATLPRTRLMLSQRLGPMRTNLLEKKDVSWHGMRCHYNGMLMRAAARRVMGTVGLRKGKFSSFRKSF